MAFQLHIRCQLDASATDFGAGDVRSFTRLPVVIGSAPDCDCRVDAAAFLPRHVRLEAGEGNAVAARPLGDAVVFLDGSRLRDRAVLRSGNELRVEHWTIGFHREHPGVSRSCGFGLLSLSAKILVTAVLLTEVLLVTWLPRHLYRAALWEAEAAQQRIAMLLDDLRRANRPDAAAGGDFERALRKSIDRELTACADYVARHGQRLTAPQNRAMHQELLDYQRILSNLQTGDLPPALPALSVEAGVQALLRRHRRTVSAP